MSDGRSEWLTDNEIKAMLITTQKQVTALSHQLELVIDQATRLHDKLCDCATRLGIVVHFGFGGDDAREE